MQIKKKYKNSFFLSNAHYMNGKPMGIVVDKMLKKSSKAMLIRSIYNLTTGDDGSKWVYYANEKIDINYEEDVNSKWLGNFGTYLLQDLYILPKYLEKFYLDIVKKLRPLQELYYNINYGERVSGERLIKKIS